MKLLLFILLFVVSVSAENLTVIESKYLLDTNHTYTTQDIYQARDTFSEFSYVNDTFGLLDDTLWIYIKLKNTSQEESSNVVEFLYALHDYIYVMEYSDSKVVDEYLTGDLTKHETRKLDTNNIVIPYTIKPNETKEFMFKVDSRSTLNMGMNFLSKDEFYAKSKDKGMILASYYGAVLIMLLYNMVLYLMIRERVYLYYVLFHISFTMLQLSLNGFAFTYLWPNTPEINKYFFPIIFIITNFYSIVFANSFLELKQYGSKVANYFKVLMILHGVILFATFFIPYASSLKIMIALSLVSINSLLITSVYILINYKTVASKFFVIAWSAILIGAMLAELQNLGILSMNIFVSYASQWGAFIELALLSFALAYRYNDVFNKLVTSESEIRALNEHLQEKVEDQTKDLRLMIKELNHRVKNNFQVILTFLWAQKKSTKEQSALKALEQTKQRIYAISSLHELLNISDTVSIDINGYIQGILNSFMVENSEINYESRVEFIMLDYDEAVTIGLILNELITNSNKYAFKDISEPSIKVQFYEKDDTHLFKYSDNGIGFDVDNLANKSGLGYDLIHGFAQKTNAKVSVSSNDGMELTIIFNKSTKEDI